jgi:signal transduction histidine kinase
MMRPAASLLLCLGLITSCGVMAAAETGMSTRHALDVAEMGAEPISLTDRFAVLEDTQRALTLDDIRRAEGDSRFQTGQAAGRALNFGVTNSAWWLRLPLRNSSAVDVRRMLEISYPRLAESVQLYYPTGTGRYALIDTGYSKPFAERPYKHHHYVFPLTLPPYGEQVLYLRFQSPSTIEIPARLWRPDAFHSEERASYMVQALYFGMVLAMASFNLLLFVALRDTNYLLYVAFICASALTLAANNGLAIQYLWGSSPFLSSAAHTLGFLVSSMLLIVFMRRMVRTRELVPHMDALLKATLIVESAMIVGLSAAFPLFLKPALLVLGVSVFLILLTALRCALKGDRGGRFFAAAYLVLCVAGVMSSLRALGVLPTNVVTTEGIQFGSAIEMILLAFALADRYNQMRREKAAAQRVALQAQAAALQAEQRVVETLRASERQLEDRVQARTEALSASITQLKRTQSELVQAEKLASLGALVAGVSHELNTPIGNAIMASSTLEEATRDLETTLAQGKMKRSSLADYAKNVRPMTDLILRSCQRAAALILSFKQVAVDQASEQRRSFDLRTLVDDNIAALMPRFKGAPWVVVNDIPADIACDSYPGPLGRVISNLVQNAFVHAFEGCGSGTVRISAEVENGIVAMCIVDDGRGMEMDVLCRIFEPFFTTRLGQGGSGLGLSVAMNLVMGVLGGVLFATSQPGQGSRFMLNFPLAVSVK